MDKLLASTFVAIAAMYTEPVAGGFFFGFVLPLVGLTSLYFLLRLEGTLIVLCGFLSFYFMDVNSESLLLSLLLPLVFGGAVMAFGIWAWYESCLHGSGWSDPGSDGGFGGGDCGGDGGGC